MLIRRGSLVVPLSLVVVVLLLSLNGSQSFIPIPRIAVSSTATTASSPVTTRAMRLPLAASTTSASAAACQRLALLGSRRTRQGLPSHLALLNSTPKLRIPPPRMQRRTTVSLLAAARRTCYQSSLTADRRTTRQQQQQQHLASPSSLGSISRSTAPTTHGESMGEASSSPSSSPSPLPRPVRRAVGSNMRNIQQQQDSIPLPSQSSSSSEDTIFALATGNAGPAGVAVVRISGPQSAQVLEALTAAPVAVRRASGASAAAGDDGPSAQQQALMGGSTTEPAAGDSTAAAAAVWKGGKGEVEGKEEGRRAMPFPAARRAVVRRLYDPVGGDLLDEALVLWMPGPRRYKFCTVCEYSRGPSNAVRNTWCIVVTQGCLC